MATPRLPEVEQLAGRLAEEIEARPAGGDYAWLIRGAGTAGKSATLRRLADALAELGQLPVLCAPPARALDAGPMVLAELAAGLKDSGIVNGQTDALRDPEMPLTDKVARVREWIENADAPIVLLLDEPANWPDASDESRHFADHARLVIDALVGDVPTRRVLTGKPPGNMRFVNRSTLAGSTEPHAFLSDGDWGAVAGAAADLQSELGPKLDALSPLQLRLLVALVDVASVDRAADLLAAPAPSRRSISRHLLTALREHGGFQDLLSAWRRLARIRRAFDGDLLRTTASGLSERSEALLRHCLLYEVDSDLYLLHETLRADISEPEPEADHEEENRSELRRLSAHYESQRDRAEAQGSGQALPIALDSSYYAARGGDTKALSEQQPYFADHLDILGKTLSYEQHRYADAAAVFDRAAALDPDDDYAHHYLAYNLDRLAGDPAQVEHHYRRAIELNGQHAWWRARLVQFLLTRGRSGAAEDEWDRALDDLGTSADAKSPRFYETLHGWVAETALRRSQLAFATQVIDDVPLEARTRSPQITALVRRLGLLKLAEEEGAYVPAQYLEREWWRHGPFLLGRRSGDGKSTLRRWLAGRVEQVDGREIELRVREIRMSDEQPPRSASLRMRVTEFDKDTRDQYAGDLSRGRFVEVGLYTDDQDRITQREIRVHAERSLAEDALQQRGGATDRYLPGSQTG